MAGSSTRRRLATVLFVDIVGSTALASRIGDGRWRDVLGRFHRVARAEVSRYGGRTQDTAGDGLLATFTDPVAAIDSAWSTIAAVRGLGLNVRAGIHSGACAEVDGKLQGIAVNIGARVTALAGPAELLTTATVRDLVVGSGFGFEERGTHELRGVEGRWPVFAVATAKGEPLPKPLRLDESEEIIEALTATRRPAYRRPSVIGAVALVVAAAIAVPLLAFHSTASARPISLVRIDARAARVTAVVRDDVSGQGRWANLWVADRTLWQLVGSSPARVIEREPGSGRIVRTLTLGADVCTCRVTVGFGSIWAAVDVAYVKSGFGVTRSTLNRIDGQSGRRETLLLPSSAAAISTSDRAVWVVAPDGALIRVDPVGNRMTARFKSLGTSCEGNQAPTLFSVVGYEWIAEGCIGAGEGGITRVDPATGVTKTFVFPVSGQLLADESPHRPTTLWLLDRQGSTLMQMDPSSGQTSQPTGLEGTPQQAVVAFGAVWVAAGTIVDRVDLQTQQRTTMAMPAGMWAGSIAADPTTSTIWVGNSVSPPPPAGSPQ